MRRLSTLLVDDDSYARDLLASILRELGCTVVHAVSSGEDAVRKAGKSRVDILFLDIEMPGMSGFEAMEKILKDTPEQYVIMISAHSTLDNVKKAIQLGAKGFIVKPYTSAKVRDLLEKHRRDRSRPGAESPIVNGDETDVDNAGLDVDLAVESSDRRV